MAFRLLSFAGFLLGGASLSALSTSCSLLWPNQNDRPGISTQWVRHIPNGKSWNDGGWPSDPLYIPFPDGLDPIPQDLLFQEPLPHCWTQFYIVVGANEGFQTSVILETLDGSHRCVVYDREKSAPPNIIPTLDGPGMRLAVVRFPQGRIRLKVTEHTTGQFLEKDIDLNKDLTRAEEITVSGDERFLCIWVAKNISFSIQEFYPGRL